MTHDRKGWAIPSALAQCELEGFCWTWSSSGVSDCAFPISLNVFGIVAVILDSLKPRHHGKVPYPRRGESRGGRVNCLVGVVLLDFSAWPECSFGVHCQSVSIGRDLQTVWDLQMVGDHQTVGDFQKGFMVYLLIVFLNARFVSLFN